MFKIAHSAVGSRAWHQHLLRSSVGLMVDGITIVRSYMRVVSSDAEERFRGDARLPYDNPFSWEPRESCGNLF